MSTSTWDSVYWDGEQQCLVFDWGELKKSQQMQMTYHPDAHSWELDEFNCLACYLLCGPGDHKASASEGNSKINWMFPAYVDMADGGAASKVGRILEKCRQGGVKGIPEDAQSHGLRVTAMDEMIFNPLLSIFASMAHGGWDCINDSPIWKSSSWLAQPKSKG